MVWGTLLLLRCYNVIWYIVCLLSTREIDEFFNKTTSFTFKSILCLNPIWQKLQTYGLGIVPVCVSKCFFKLYVVPSGIDIDVDIQIQIDLDRHRWIVTKRFFALIAFMLDIGVRQMMPSQLTCNFESNEKENTKRFKLVENAPEK